MKENLEILWKENNKIKGFFICAGIKLGMNKETLLVFAEKKQEEEKAAESSRQEKAQKNLAAYYERRAAGGILDGKISLADLGGEYFISEEKKSELAKKFGVNVSHQTEELFFIDDIVAACGGKNKFYSFEKRGWTFEKNRNT